ncbi:carbohydrate kinase [Cnuibacter physcomitrellae]|uniref:carbohydrate kinase family protein n=1 Tax=Cnuibacter physcomitrellae TaxID=1619308 RepID=UPI002175721B|nr:carbohydrate kinase [Cnuibacter physcomitrellae]MCS5497202.1 carbohydrate kinase [Cnuibacter physcomitrellae]
MAARILAVGESIMDVVVGPDGSHAHPGGSPANIAYGLARLGHEVSLLTALADDDFGRALAEHLEGAGVEVLDASWSAERTSTATATIGGDGAARYDFDVSWSIPDGAVVPPASILHTGSIAAFLEPGASAVETLFAAERARSLLSLDPNIRPALVGDHADALARFERLAGLADVVKLSDEDADWLYPGLSVEDAAHRIRDLGPLCVAVTRGAEGALLVSASAVVSVPGRKVEVADTIGAGDSFMSALLHVIAADLDASATDTPDARLDVDAWRAAEAFDERMLARLGDVAVRCAAITCSRPGANPPTAAELAAS